MILTCPSCSTQYVVKDGAIPPQGRQVRCASCKHSWHQDADRPAQDQSSSIDEAMTTDKGGASGEARAEPAQEAVVEPADQADDYGDVEDRSALDAGAASEAEGRADGDESLVEATMIEPRAGPEAEERAFEEAMVGETPVAHEAEERGEWVPPSHDEAARDEDFSPFAAEDGGETGRRPLLMVAILAVVVAVLAALFWFAAPASWKARIGLAAGGASPLALVTTHMDRQRLESGNELLTVTGRVINPTAEEQRVPPLQAQLKSATGKVVYSWTIAPPAQSLAPGASASFNSAEVNVPPGGEEITLTLGAPKA